MEEGRIVLNAWYIDDEYAKNIKNKQYWYYTCSLKNDRSGLQYVTGPTNILLEDVVLNSLNNSKFIFRTYKADGKLGPKTTIPQAAHMFNTKEECVNAFNKNANSCIKAISDKIKEVKDEGELNIEKLMKLMQ